MEGQDAEAGGGGALSSARDAFQPGQLSTPEDSNSPGVPAPMLSRRSDDSEGSRAVGTGWNVFGTPLDRRTTTNISSNTSFMAETTPLRSIGTHYLLPAEDSVYSYLLFMPPIEQRRTKRFFTSLILFAICLVVINFVMQTGLLLVVGNHIMYKHNHWMSSMVHIKRTAWYHLFPMPYNYPPPACRGEDETICSDKGDGISCAPASIHVLTDWNLLDSDGDGLWSREEARNKELREAVQCGYGVDLLGLYNRISKQINASDVMQGRRDTDLFSGNAINKAYYNWYLHKPLLCQYGDPDMCGALFHRGFFDEALRQQPFAASMDTESLLQFCTKTLQTECYDILPTSYKVWRSREKQQCGERIFGQSMYQVPDSVTDDDSSDIVGRSIPMLTVDFRVQKTYESTQGYPFRMFLVILLVTFLSVMFLEMKSILAVMKWTWLFPRDNDAGLDGNVVGKQAVQIVVNGDKDKGDSDSEEGKKSYNCEAVSKAIFATRMDHRIVVGVMTLCRLLLWVFLLWSGIMFLTGEPRYLTLIFDALSLVFIFEIDEVLYKTMIRYELKQDHLTCDDMRVRHFSGGFLSGRHTVLMDLAQFIGIIVFGIAIVYTYCTVEMNPLSDAISCLCSKDGPRCHDAQHFSKSWWDEYWSTTLPAANLIIDQLKQAF